MSHTFFSRSYCQNSNTVAKTTDYSTHKCVYDFDIIRRASYNDMVVMETCSHNLFPSNLKKQNKKTTP